MCARNVRIAIFEIWNKSCEITHLVEGLGNPNITKIIDTSTFLKHQIRCTGTH